MWGWSDKRVGSEGVDRGGMHVPDKVSSIWGGLEATDSMGQSGRWEGGRWEIQRLALEWEVKR